MGNRCEGCKFQKAVTAPCVHCKGDPCAAMQRAEKAAEMQRGRSAAHELHESGPGGFRAALAAGHGRRTQAHHPWYP